MKKTLLLATFLFSVFTLNAQEQTRTARVEKSLFGIQTGFLGIWVHNESRLSNSIVLRSEIGLNLRGKVSIYIGNSEMNEIATYIGPVLTLEPRWYYNLDKRVSKGKSIVNNSGNFIGLNISYAPDWFAISNTENLTVRSKLLIIPKWAIKRTIGEHFTYEVGFGLGYYHIFNQAMSLYRTTDENGIAVDLHLRIGYTF